MIVRRHLLRPRILHTQIVHTLVHPEDIDVNLQGNHGRTALITAAHHGRTEMANTLMRHEGMDVHLRDNNGETALIVARSNEYAGTAAIRVPHEVISQKGFTTLVK